MTDDRGTPEVSPVDQPTIPADELASRSTESVPTVPSVPAAGTPVPSAPVEPAPVPEPLGWSDALTGADGPRYWDRMLSTETARVRRYGRTATVALVEVAGLDVLARRWGRDVAERLFVKVGRALAREARSSDVVARIAPTRFAVLLTETDEIAAINFVERARAACESELGETATIVRIGIGWASPSRNADLPHAVEVASVRLAEDLARPA